MKTVFTRGKKDMQKKEESSKERGRKIQCRGTKREPQERLWECYFQNLSAKM